MSESDSPLLGELQKIKAARQRRRRKKYPRLDRHRGSVEALRAGGASLEDIRLWLRQYAKIMVHRSTVARALARWRREDEAAGG